MSKDRFKHSKAYISFKGMPELIREEIGKACIRKSFWQEVRDWWNGTDKKESERLLFLVREYSDAGRKQQELERKSHEERWAIIEWLGDTWMFGKKDTPLCDKARKLYDMLHYEALSMKHFTEMDSLIEEIKATENRKETLKQIK